MLGKGLKTLWLAVLMGLLASFAVPGVSDASFVTRTGEQLVLDGKPYRITWLNVYNDNSRV